MNKVEKVKGEVANAVKEFMKSEADQILEGTNEALTLLSKDLPKWIEGFNTGEITKDDLKYLVRQSELAMEVKGQELKSLSKINLERLQNRVIDVIVLGLL